MAPSGAVLLAQITAAQISNFCFSQRPNRPNSAGDKGFHTAHIIHFYTSIHIRKLTCLFCLSIYFYFYNKSEEKYINILYSSACFAYLQFVVGQQQFMEPFRPIRHRRWIALRSSSCGSDVSGRPCSYRLCRLS